MADFQLKISLMISLHAHTNVLMTNLSSCPKLGIGRNSSNAVSRCDNFDLKFRVTESDINLFHD